VSSRSGLRIGAHLRQLGLLLAVCAPAAPVFALDPNRAISQYTVRTWRGGAEFPQDPTIQAITQTPDGYLWLGTMEGLLRFDGVGTTVFAGRKDGLPHDNVWGLRVDRDGRLWAGTDGGGLVVWKNGPEQYFDARSGLAGDTVRPILQTRDGAIWVGTARDGLNRYKDGQWRHLTKKDGLADNAVWSLTEAEDGGVWVGAGGVNLCRADATACTALRTQREGLPGDGVSALLVARNGDLWAGCWAGLSRLRGGVWTDWRVKDGLPGGVVRALLEDRDGNLWIGTNDGLARFRDGLFERIARQAGASNIYVRALFEDREGTLWVGGLSSGLLALSDGQFLNIGESEGLSPNIALDALPDPDGTLWVGTSKGLRRWQHGAASDAAGPPADQTEALARDPADAQTLWIASGRQLVQWNAKTGIRHVYSEKNGLLSGLIRCLYFDRAGTLWVGSSAGASALRHGQWRHYRTEEGLPHPNVFSILEGRGGTIWLGTNRGIVRLRDGRLSTQVAKNPGPAMSIYTMYEDPTGVLWAGSSRGLWRLENETWTTFDLSTGFCSNATHFMLEDDLGYLWTTSPKGLCRASRTALDAYAREQVQTVPWRVYDRSDGIRDTGFGVGTAPKGGTLADGRLFFVSPGGLVLVDPHALRVESAPPATVESLAADNVPVPLGAAIALGPGRPRLELRFTALTLLAPEKIRFRYKLEGFDPDWVDAGVHRTAYYTNLPPREYAFRVSAANSDGVWNDTGTPLRFRVRPHVWETSWFRAASLLALVGLAFGAYRWRLRLMREQAAELERRVQEGIKHIQTLKGLLPICASCKKIRDDGGYWNQIESYVAAHSAAEFSHSICPDCMTKLYPDYAADAAKTRASR
jgi:ligand-binding sensor domain-containing protein